MQPHERAVAALDALLPGRRPPLPPLPVPPPAPVGDPDDAPARTTPTPELRVRIRRRRQRRRALRALGAGAALAVTIALVVPGLRLGWAGGTVTPGLGLALVGLAAALPAAWAAAIAADGDTRARRIAWRWGAAALVAQVAAAWLVALTAAAVPTLAAAMVAGGAVGGAAAAFTQVRARCLPLTLPYVAWTAVLAGLLGARAAP